MTFDSKKLEALAKAATGDCVKWYTLEQLKSRAVDESAAELMAAANPAAVLDLISSGKRMAARLMYCPACQGQGEIYSGRSSYEGYNQPPEPIMGKCGECDGDGALGGTAECISILEELETLRASVHGLKTGYEAYERVNAELRAECEKLRKYGEEFASLAERRREEVEALRKDSARYKWTSTEGNWVARFHGKWRAHVGEYGVGQPTDWYPSREEAIDAAMSKEQSHD